MNNHKHVEYLISLKEKIYTEEEKLKHLLNTLYNSRVSVDKVLNKVCNHVWRIDNWSVDEHTGYRCSICGNCK